tara:strand:+ start:345 stop:845 length:501 start_codon:yes stop_codon:yes gene_type:complete
MWRFKLLSIIISAMGFSHHQPSIKLTSVTQTNEILHQWMTDISQSPYLVEHEINSNDSQLVGITKGLIMTTKVPSCEVINETLLCFVVRNEASPIAIGITILDDHELYLDNICFYPGINEDPKYYKIILNHCKKICLYHNYTLDISKLPDRQKLECIFTIGGKLAT